MSRTRRRQIRAQGAKPQTPAADDNLLDAKNQLWAAVHDLTGLRSTLTPDGHQTWLTGRYSTLRASLYGGRDSHTRTAPSSLIPTWIDALKLLITIDRHAATLEREHPPRTSLTSPAGAHPTIRRIHQLLTVPWRPQDARQLTTISNDLAGYSKAVDDLFAPKPIFLPNPCPHCGQDHAYQTRDDGDHVRVAALAITAEHGAICANCHDTWPPDQLVFLGRILGYTTKGIVA